MQVVIYNLRKWRVVGLLLLTVSVLSCRDDVKRRQYSEFYELVVPYSNYSTVDWQYIDSLYYRPYNSDWDESISELINNSEFPIDIATKYWHLLQNAKTEFIHKTLPLRNTSCTKELRKEIDQTASLFDTVFVQMVRQDYYMRLFPDVYNEVIGEYLLK